MVTLSGANPVESSEAARHIARVAARLFATRGYDATPVRVIVEEAGVTKPTLYYHFKSKEGLARALFTEPMDRLMATLRGLLETPGEPVALLVAAVETHLAFCRADPDRVRFFYSLFFGRPLDLDLSAELATCGEGMDRLMEAAVGRLAEAGLVAADRVAPFAEAIRGRIVVRTMDFLYRGRELGPEVAGQVVNDLLRGFGERGCGA